MDAFGNEILTIDWGNAAQSDPVIATQRTILVPPNVTDGWSWRPMTTSTSYAQSTGTPIPGAPARAYSYTYTPQGQLATVTGQLSGVVPLARASGGAPSPLDAVPTTSSPQLVSLSYDAYGNVATVQTPNGRCVGFQADPTFGQFPVSQTAYISGCGSGGALVTSYRFDPGFGVKTYQLLPDGEQSQQAFDEFGRLLTVSQANDSTSGVDPYPAISITYINDTGPARLTDVQTVDGPDTSPISVDHYIFQDAYGDTLARLDRAGLSTDPTPSWIVSGVHNEYPNGLVASQYKPGIWTGNPTVFPEQTWVGPAQASFVYDGLGRPLSGTNYNGGVSTRLYHPGVPSVTMRDAEQTNGSHTAAYSVVSTNGHGQTIETDQHFNVGPLGQAGDLYTSVAYLATGEPAEVSESNGTTVLYARQMAYDTLGHMVYNSEPNTNGGGAGAWIYAYNANGELVGTSDARGCGENIIHDTLGRVVGEDYSPCTPTQPAYTSTWEVTSWYAASGLLLGTMDRAQTTEFRYDSRARVNELTRWIAAPAGPGGDPGSYAPHEYIKNFTYSEANRVTSETTGSDVSAMQVAGASSVSYSYMLQGVLASVGSSYGSLLANQTVNATGNPLSQVLGDVAKTSLTMTYNPNEWLTSYSVTRGTPGPWASNYTKDPPPNPPTQANPLPLTFQQTLASITVVPDRVGNITSITDTSPSSAWPPGAQPASHAYTYSDDYRLTGSTSTYASAGGVDTFVTPYTAGETAQATGTFPSPQPVLGGNRVAKQTYAYDWLGNTQTTTDDSGVFLDRSLGTITNGGSGFGPNQLSGATGLEKAVPSIDSTELVYTAYDAAGNLTGWSLNDKHTTPVIKGVGGGTVIEEMSEYQYTWDELGRLSAATRYDQTQEVLVQETYAYAASGQRISTNMQTCVACTAIEAAPADGTFTIRVFPSLTLTGASFETDYTDTDATEQLYLPMAHVVYDTAYNTTNALPAAGANGALHVFFAVGDHLGSTSFVIDQGTSELVERPTYQPFAQVESDYRPARWGAFREVMRHSGHEDDARVGLIYFGARYYAPQLTRWVSPDPLAIHGLGADLNPYAYVGGSPVTNIDPFGLEDCDGSDGQHLCLSARCSDDCAPEQFRTSRGRDQWKFVPESTEPRSIFAAGAELGLWPPMATSAASAWRSGLVDRTKRRIA